MPKTMDLFFYRRGDEIYVSNKLPRLMDGKLDFFGEDMMDNDKKDGAVETEICDNGLRLFGIDREDLANDNIVRVTINVGPAKVGNYQLSFVSFRGFRKKNK